MIPYRPEFVPGDLVEVIEYEFIPTNGKPFMTKGINLFTEPGQPPLVNRDTDISRVMKEMKEHQVGYVPNGRRCLVVASRFFDGDKKWYYLLRGPDYSKCFGWSRHVHKLKKVT